MCDRARKTLKHVRQDTPEPGSVVQSINHVVLMVFLPQVVSFFHVNFSDTQRALKLLEEYRSKLNQPEDAQLQHSIDRVISVFQSSLFHALIGKHLHGEIKRNPL